MHFDRESRRPGRELRRRAAVTYAVAWLAGGALAALAIVALIRVIGGPDPTVPVRPVLQPSLDVAVRSADCRMDETPRDATVVSAAAAPGVYDAPLDPRSRAGSLRDGLVVIEHRPDADEDTVRDLFEAVPEGTVVAPRDGLADAVAVSSWRRELRCPRLDTAAVDAIRLFRGRFLGRAPGP